MAGLPFTLERVPFGRYRLNVRTPLLAQGRQQFLIEVDKPELWQTVSLPLATALSPIELRPETPLVGVLEDLGNIQQMAWLKIVGVYADIVVETTATADGRFTVSGLPEGIYLAIVSIPDQKPYWVRFEFRADRLPVRISRPERE